MYDSLLHTRTFFVCSASDEALWLIYTMMRWTTIYLCSQIEFYSSKRTSSPIDSSLLNYDNTQIMNFCNCSYNSSGVILNYGSSVYNYALLCFSAQYPMHVCGSKRNILRKMNFSRF